MHDLNTTHLSRRSFFGLIGAGAMTACLGLAGCGSSDAGKGGAATSGGDTAATGSSSIDEITMVWLPNESAAEFDKGREEFGKVLEKYAGVPVKLMTTTDYNVAIEAISSGKAQLANMGAEGFIQAQKKNSKVVPLVTTSDANGSSTARSTTAACACPKATSPPIRTPPTRPATPARTSSASA